MGSEEHERIAKAIARKEGTQYKPETRGPDIVTPRRVIEVGIDPLALAQEARQVQRSSKVRYLAGPPDFVQQAIKQLQGTGIGVMDGRGHIVRRGTRGRRR